MTTSQNQDLLYVADLARKLGRTEAAIRSGVIRNVDWLPPRLQGPRLVWRAATVDRWLSEQEQRPAGAASDSATGEAG